MYAVFKTGGMYGFGKNEERLAALAFKTFTSKLLWDSNFRLHFTIKHVYFIFSPPKYELIALEI